MPRNNLRQALVPEGAKYILNSMGTAPGLIIPLKNEAPATIGRGAVLKTVIALPGVPFELYSMFEKTVIPYIQKTFHPEKVIKSRIIKITGLAESKVNEKIEDILKMAGNVQMGIYPHPEEISVKITVTEKNNKKALSVINGIEGKIRSRLKNHIFGYDNETLEEIVGRGLVKTKQTLSIAESCTGGLLANRITDVAGSSYYFPIGMVTYSNESKNKILHIPLDVMRKYGVVSGPVAGLMAKNVRLLSGADIGIGISGIVGPGGGTKKKPVGLVYIGLSTKKRTISKEFRFLGQRNIIKCKATQAALDMIRKILF